MFFTRACGWRRMLSYHSRGCLAPGRGNTYKSCSPGLHEPQALREPQALPAVPAPLTPATESADLSYR